MSQTSCWCASDDETRCALQGPWAPRKIANPHHFVDDAPLSKLGKIGAAAVEIWTMDTGYYFDNVLVASSPATAAAHRERHWAPKLAAEVRGRQARAHARMCSRRGAPAHASPCVSMARRHCMLLIHHMIIKPSRVHMQCIRFVAGATGAAPDAHGSMGCSRRARRMGKQHVGFCCDRRRPRTGADSVVVRRQRSWPNRTVRVCK